jgi:hypothetical protein
MAANNHNEVNMGHILNFSTDGTPIFAAFAAAAAWASLIAGQRIARERRQPYLHASPLQVVDADANGRAATSLVILNSGFGIANRVRFVLKVGREYCSNPVGPGLLRHGQGARVRTTMRPDSDQRAIVMCEDRRGNVWAWNHLGRCKCYKGKRASLGADPRAVWMDFYGEDLDDGLGRTGSQVDVDL